jgi:hypothetical protein
MLEREGKWRGGERERGEQAVWLRSGAAMMKAVKNPSGIWVCELGDALCQGHYRHWANGWVALKMDGRVGMRAVVRAGGREGGRREGGSAD